MIKVGRNDPCTCGSGKKFKKCCYMIQSGSLKQQPSNISNHAELLSEFQGYGIDTSKPGFYDSRAFMAVERVQPDFLNKYAAFVNSIEFSSDYLLRAEKNIPIVASALFEELKLDGRLGACVDISSLLSRCLEEEGFWNYQAVGPLTIRFNSSTGVRDKYFWAVDKDLPPDSVAHAWIVAPPYTVIDLSVNLQPYKQGEERYLPDYVISKSNERADVSVEDIFEPETRVMLKRHGITSYNSMMQGTIPHALGVMDKFPPIKVSHDNVELKYITIAIRAPDCSFKEMANISLRGKGPYETYQKVIIPLLHDK